MIIVWKIFDESYDAIADFSRSMMGVLKRKIIKTISCTYKKFTNKVFKAPC